MTNQVITSLPPETMIRMFNALDVKGCSRTAAERVQFHQLWNELEAIGLISYTADHGFHGPE